MKYFAESANKAVENGDQKASYIGGNHLSGLTKREHFAGLAMQGILAGGQYGSGDVEEVGELSVQFTDCLLKELEV